jgi:hypothetical protein
MIAEYVLPLLVPFIPLKQTPLLPPQDTKLLVKFALGVYKVEEQRKLCRDPHAVIGEGLRRSADYSLLWQLPAWNNGQEDCKRYYVNYSCFLYLLNINSVCDF